MPSAFLFLPFAPLLHPVSFQIAVLDCISFIGQLLRFFVTSFGRVFWRLSLPCLHLVCKCTIGCIHYKLLVIVTIVWIQVNLQVKKQTKPLLMFWLLQHNPGFGNPWSRPNCYNSDMIVNFNTQLAVTCSTLCRIPLITLQQQCPPTRDISAWSWCMDCLYDYTHKYYGNNILLLHQNRETYVSSFNHILIISVITNLTQ